MNSSNLETTVSKILGLKFDRILFDNMSNKNLRKGVQSSKKLYETEASGGITLKNVRKIASTGVKRISVGQITHSAPAVNFKLEISPNNIKLKNLLIVFICAIITILIQSFLPLNFPYDTLQTPIFWHRRDFLKKDG